jgi:hypothetical protein
MLINCPIDFIYTVYKVVLAENNTVCATGSVILTAKTRKLKWVVWLGKQYIKVR